jgi:hypothetical protein
MEHVVAHAPHLVDINGWRFNFELMLAKNMAYSMTVFPNYIPIIWCEHKLAITVEHIYINVLRKPTTSNYGTWDWGIWFSFFVPPEDSYNQMINDAYITYLFEKSLKS